MSNQDPRWRTRRPDAADGPVIDMTPDGHFIPTRGAPPLTAKAMGVLLLVAVVAGAAAIAALALWIAMTLIPIAIGAAVIGYGVLRFRIWRARRASLGGQRNLYPM